MNQDCFDEIIQLVLETISSYEYLNYNGIHRVEEPLNKSEFKKFKTQLNKQTLKPGIYPKKIGNSVHYYGVSERIERHSRSTSTSSRRSSRTLKKKSQDKAEIVKVIKVANGYPSAAGLGKYSIGLDVQRDHSHGLCQTYALMYYLGYEDRLKKGEDNYFSNIMIGLKFLLEFINENKEDRDWEWNNSKDLINSLDMLRVDDEIRLSLYKKLFGKKKIKLSQLIKILMKYKSNLEIWFEDD